jgi:outer membrane protein, heavy metal efflux system
MEDSLFSREFEEYSMRKGMAWAMALLAISAVASGQNTNQLPNVPAGPPAAAPASGPTERITLDDAIRLALQHNHALQAMRTTILQNQDLEVTANLRPNPVLSWDAQFLPVFTPDQFTSDYLNNNAQFDIGIGYLFERGGKRQRRLQAAKDVTGIARFQVTDNERTLTFNVAQQFIATLLAQSTLDFAEQDLKSFAKTVEISQERRRAGDMSEGDLLKIKLQQLQFQTDVASAKLAKVQAIAALRQLVGYESVPEQFDVAGDLDYQPVHTGLDELKAMSLRTRPDLMAARQGVISAESQVRLAVANGKQDLTATVDYSHVNAASGLSFFFNIPLAVFNRNQGEIARTKHVVTQMQEQASETAEQAITDVVDAYFALQMNDQIVQLYRGGYVDDAKQSRDISEYAYRHGAASLLDFLDAERTYRSNQLGYRQALASYMTALEQMRQAVGTRNLP